MPVTYKKTLNLVYCQRISRAGLAHQRKQLKHQFERQASSCAFEYTNNIPSRRQFHIEVGDVR